MPGGLPFTTGRSAAISGKLGWAELVFFKGLEGRCREVASSPGCDGAVVVQAGGGTGWGAGLLHQGLAVLENP